MSDHPRLSRSAAPRPRAGIVHLGPGAFFRAFNAIYTAEALAAEPGDWGIVAVSTRSAAARDRLVPQGHAYTSVTLAPDGERHELIESIVDVLVAPEDPEAVLRAMSDPAVRIVSLTVTEKGYCREPATGALQLDHPDIRADLGGGPPRSVPGLLVEALARRRAAGVEPFTVLSCDNLPDNGRTTRTAALDFARERDADLAHWIRERVRFPATMVDRITPATTEADIDRLAAATGYRDLACVQHEPFRQWVIEDDFGAGRPAWEAGGAQLVASVGAHETMKLRCLNGTHSILAYLGYLAGHETIADAVADDAFAALCGTLWRREILPSVARPEGEDPPAYCAALLRRYANPAIRHRTWQIAMDGSQKLPQRLLGTVADNLGAGRPIEGLALGVAGWMRYVGGIDERGRAIDVRDPLADRLRTLAAGGSTPEGTVAALLTVRDVFDASVAGDERFRGAVTAAYTSLVERGAAATVAGFAALA